jgi:ribosome biogenesis GTPase
VALFTVVSHHGVAVLLENSSRERHLFPLTRGLKVVVGDILELSGHEARVLPRKNTLRRKATVSLSQTNKWARANKPASTKKTTADEGATKILAANLDLAAIVMAPIPQTPVLLIDKIIIACRLENIEPCIVLNKCDLEESVSLLALLRTFFGGELEVFGVVAGHGRETKTGENGLEQLKSYLASKGRSIFVGVSGSGKSSLTNELLSGRSEDGSSDKAHATVGLLTAGGRHGAHTTASSTLYHLPSGGDLIDCPGIRDFKPVDLSPPMVAQYFVGFAAQLKTPCAFRSCLHEHEPGCSVLLGVENGAISKNRYDDYLKLLSTTK